MLYHYTDFIALDGILNKKEIWLNNVLNMNDKKEMTYFYDELFKIVIAKLKDDGLDSKAREMHKFFLDNMNGDYQHSAYAACFSRFFDEAAQWERYGSGGNGVCLEFNEDYLHKITKGALSLKEVYYNSDISDHDLVTITYNLIKKSALSGENIKVTEEFIKDLITDIWVQSVAYKHPSFANEKEVRLVFFPFLSSDFSMEPHYKVLKSAIKKYYPLNLGYMCERNNILIEDLITGIIIGPSSNQSVPILEDYLKDLNLNKLAKNIKKSECPLRRSFK